MNNTLWYRLCIYLITLVLCIQAKNSSCPQLPNLSFNDQEQILLSGNTDYPCNEQKLTIIPSNNWLQISNLKVKLTYIGKRPTDGCSPNYSPLNISKEHLDDDSSRSQHGSFIKGWCNLYVALAVIQNDSLADNILGIANIGNLPTCNPCSGLAVCSNQGKVLAYNNYIIRSCNAEHTIDFNYYSCFDNYNGNIITINNGYSLVIAHTVSCRDQGYGYSMNVLGYATYTTIN